MRVGVAACTHACSSPVPGMEYFVADLLLRCMQLRAAAQYQEWNTLSQICCCAACSCVQASTADLSRWKLW